MLSTLACFILVAPTVLMGQVFQPKQLIYTEGDKISINCTQNISSHDNMFWYKQKSQQDGGILTLLGYGYEEISAQAGDFKMDVIKDFRFTRLTRDAARLRDAGVYFCALRGGSGNWKCIFGSGTRLVVKPNLDNAEPSVYKLTPAKEGTEKISACLFTDYSPGNITVGISQKDLKEAQSSIVVVKENEKDQGSYGTVLWGPAGDNFQCSASQDGNMFTEETNADAGNCINGQGTTVGPTPTAAVAPPPTFETDEQLNLLSLTVLGLRIIFFKSVAFNLLFTFRLWSS